MPTTPKTPKTPYTPNKTSTLRTPRLQEMAADSGFCESPRDATNAALISGSADNSNASPKQIAGGGGEKSGGKNRMLKAVLKLTMPLSDNTDSSSTDVLTRFKHALSNNTERARPCYEDTLYSRSGPGVPNGDTDVLARFKRTISDNTERARHDSPQQSPYAAATAAPSYAAPPYAASSQARANTPSRPGTSERGRNTPRKAPQQAKAAALEVAEGFQQVPSASVVADSESAAGGGTAAEREQLLLQQEHGQEEEEGEEPMLQLNLPLKLQERLQKAAQGQELHRVAQGQELHRVAQGQELHRVAQGQELHRVAQGQELHRVAQGQELHRVAQGQELHRVAQGQELHRVDQGQGLGHGGYEAMRASAAAHLAPLICLTPPCPSPVDASPSPVDTSPFSPVPIILSSNLGIQAWTRRAAAAQRLDVWSAGSDDANAAAEGGEGAAEAWLDSLAAITNYSSVAAETAGAAAGDGAAAGRATVSAAPQMSRRPAASRMGASRRFHRTSSCPDIEGMPFCIRAAAAAGVAEETSATEEAADEGEGGKEGQESLESRLRRWHESMGVTSSVPHASRPASPSPPPLAGLFVPGLPHWTKCSLPCSLRISRSLLSFQERALLEHRQETALLEGRVGRNSLENEGGEMWSEGNGAGNEGFDEGSMERRQGRTSVRVKSESSLLSAAAAAVAAPVSPTKSIRAAIAVYSASREFWRPPSTPKPVMDLKQAKMCLPIYSHSVPPIGLEKLMEGGTGAGGTGRFAGFAGFGAGGGWGLGASWWGAGEGAGEERKEGMGEAGWLGFEGLVDAARGMMWGGGRGWSWGGAKGGRERGGIGYRYTKGYEGSGSRGRDSGRRREGFVSRGKVFWERKCTWR
ncbi:unnamed protein product [Closterium sp. NIES-65]|nr:unnamed protein product [Closterium sp. NIES-65]